jgi:uncharacterized membrane protein
MEMQTKSAVRDDAVDWLRGLVMVVMVLDHARDFWFGITTKPLDLATTTPTLFLTRWLTHFCAPSFVLLAGAAAYLYGARRSVRERTRFLVSRGVFLVLLEVTLIRLLWVPDIFYRFTLLQVIWVIGWSLLALAGLSRLPRNALVAIGAVLVLGHNAFDTVHAARFGALAPVWHFLHERGRLTPIAGHSVVVSYPLVPWLGVMLLGYAFGPVLELEPARRRSICLRLGATLTLGFVLLRLLNGYGDPVPWTPQRSGLFTLLGFLNCEKYPPSLDYLLMTLGPTLMLLSLLPRFGDRPRFLVVFGKVPLFFYVLHLFLLRYTSLPVAVWLLGPRAFAMPPRGTNFSPELPLWITYLAWVVTLAVLYPLCRWYARVKASKRYPVLSYL